MKLERKKETRGRLQEAAEEATRHWEVVIRLPSMLSVVGRFATVKYLRLLYIFFCVQEEKKRPQVIFN